MFVAYKLPANHTAFPGFSLIPLLVSANTATANDRSRSTTAMRSTSDRQRFFVKSQIVFQAPFPQRVEENGSSSPSYCYYQARSKKSAMGGLCFGVSGRIPQPPEARGVWGQSPKRSKILHFFLQNMSCGGAVLSV